MTVYYTIFMTPRGVWLCASCANKPHNLHIPKGVDVGEVRPKEACNECGGEFLS